MSDQSESLAGWYEDPEHPGQFRCYDGVAWGDVRVSRSEVPQHLIRGIPSETVPLPRRELRADRERSGLLGLAGAWLLLALAAGVIAQGAASGGWVVAGVLVAMFPSVIAFVIGLRATVHGTGAIVQVLGIVTALVAAPGAFAAIGIALVIGLAMTMVSDGSSMLTSGPLDLFGLFNVSDTDGGVDGAHGAWLWAALGWGGTCLAVLRFGL